MHCGSQSNKRAFNSAKPKPNTQTSRVHTWQMSAVAFGGSHAICCVFQFTYTLDRSSTDDGGSQRAWRSCGPVASDTPSAKVAAQAIGDRLDLAVIGASKEPLEEAIKRLRALPGPDPDMPPRVLVLLERVDVVQLRGILSMGVEGVIDRSVGLDDLRAACERLLAGQRVLAGSPLSVLATAGLELQEPEPEEEERDNGLLTRKELEVLAELGRHLSNREIAETMHVSAATVKTHLSNIYGKLGVTSRREAVVAAVERGLLS